MAKVDQYHKAYLIFDGERVDFTLRERQRLVRRPLDDDRYKGWDKKLEPTGDLIFKITTWLPQELPTAWRDNSEKPLEWQLDDIVAVLSLTGPHLVRKRNEQAEAQKRRWQEEHQQLLSRQRREQDMKRWALMLEFAHKRDLAESVRRLIAEVEQRPQPDGRFDGRTSAEWLAWAREWLERFDPLMREPQELYAELASIRG